MRRIICTVMTRHFAAVLVVVAVMLGQTPAEKTVRVLVRTDAGDIELEVDAAHAPLTAANFLRYVDAGHYDGGLFHRTVTLANQPTDEVKIEVVQAGAKAGTERFAPVPLER